VEVVEVVVVEERERKLRLMGDGEQDIELVRETWMGRV
jgi:hypothetical protein